MTNCHRPVSGAGPLPDEGLLGRGQAASRGGPRGDAAAVDGLRAERALTVQRGEVAPLAAAGLLQVDERAVAAAVVVGVERAVEPHRLADAVGGPVRPQRELQRLGLAAGRSGGRGRSRPARAPAAAPAGAGRRHCRSPAPRPRGWCRARRAGATRTQAQSGTGRSRRARPGCRRPWGPQPGLWLRQPRRSRSGAGNPRTGPPPVSTCSETVSVSSGAGPARCSSKMAGLPSVTAEVTARMVRIAVSGPGTGCSRSCDSGAPPVEQSAPWALQPPPRVSETTTAAFESGWRVTSHRSPAMRRAAVRLPPEEPAASSRNSASSVIVISSLNWNCTVKLPLPSCRAGAWATRTARACVLPNPDCDQPLSPSALVARTCTS